ncbi:MAG: translocation/assembly module TamB domain-containing protein [Ignavibacteriae bacterium]|nr:translocation/assembly module TamB domain-containing protein [Ignavibacteriota bacterium]
MMPDDKRKYPRWLKAILWTGGFFLLLVVGIFVFMKTAAFRNLVREQVIAAASESLNGTLQIGSIDGTFYSNIRVLNATIVSNNDTVIALPRLEVAFSLLPLLKREIRIDRIVVDSLSVVLRQLKDSTWNLAHLTKPDTSAPAEFTWLLMLVDVAVRDARVRIHPIDSASLIPRAINDINVQLSGAYSEDIMDFALTSLRLETRKPNLSVKQFSLITKKEGDDLVVSDVVLQTSKNRLEAHARMSTDSLGRTEASVTIDSLDLSEFSWATQGRTFPRRPNLDVNVWMRRDSISADAKIVERKQALSGRVSIGGMKLTPVYRFDASMQNIDVGVWMNDSAMSSNLNGNIQGWMRGNSVGSAMLRVEGELSNSMLMRRTIDRLTVHAEGDRGTITAAAALDAQFGGFTLTGRVADVNGAQRYTVSGNTRNLDIAPLLLNDSLRSDLNMEFSADGSGFSPDNMRSNVDITLRPSRVRGFAIEQGVVELNVNNRRYAIERMEIFSPSGSVHAEGLVDLDGTSDLRFEARIDSLAALRQVVGADTIAGHFAIEGSISGNRDSLTISAEANLGQLQYNTVLVDSIDASFNLRNGTSVTGAFEAHAYNVNTGTLLLDNFTVSGDVYDEQRTFLVSFRGDNDLRGDWTLRYAADSIRTRISVPAFMIGYKEQELRGGSDSMWIESRNDIFTFNNITLASGDQVFAVDGRFSLKGSDDLTLTLQNLNLANLLELANVNQKAGGLLSANLRMTGTAPTPKLDGNIAITGGFVNALQYESLTCSLQYADKQFRWSSNLNITPESKLISEGMLPMKISLTDTGQVLLKNQPMHAELRSQGLTLGILQAGSDEIKAEGAVECSVKVTNTLSAMEASGRLAIINGKFEYPEYGIEYEDIQLQVDATKDNITLTRCDIRTGDGAFHGSGKVGFGGGVVGGTLATTTVDFSANEFVVADGDDVELVIDGKAQLGGNARNLQYGGNLSVSRASVWLPTFTDKMEKERAKTSVPLLVSATRRVDTTTSRKAAADSAQAVGLDYIKNLRGSLQLTIPKNTWLRGPDMQIELAGDMEVRKRGEDFELFGDIRTVRGWYEVLGKRFEIESGILDFRGGKEYNPDLNIDAQYTFRDENREERILALQITGKAYTPRFAFSLDDKRIELSDAIAYITFGRPFNSLSLGQKSSASEQGLALGFAARQLSSALGRASGLDVLEIRGGETIGQSSIAVGKYISNDLFMSVEKQFGSGESDSPATQIITLEYELTKFLFLQLIQGDQKNSGFDVFLKLEK